MDKKHRKRKKRLAWTYSHLTCKELRSHVENMWHGRKRAFAKGEVKKFPPDNCFISPEVAELLMSASSTA